MSGTVNIARSIFDHELFADQPLTEREAWIWLIMEASWKPRKKRVGDYIAELSRGQLAASVRFMAGAWQWTPAKVQRFVKRLQNLEMISVKTDTGVSVITICNYDEYQAPSKASDTDAIQMRYKSDTNEKKGEIREEGKEKRGKPLSAPDGFDEFWAEVPRKVSKDDARKAYAKALRKADARTLIEAMRRYAQSRIGQDPQYTKHPASWLNAGKWEDEPEPMTGGNHGNSKGERRIQSWLAGASIAPRVDCGPDTDASLPLLARR